jgi:hypothetical protein
VKFYVVDLSKIKGRGDFTCPKCGVKISPDDKTERSYTISEPMMKGDQMERLILQCNTCGSQIHLTGFHVLNRLK